MPAARYGRRCASAVGIPLAVLAVLGALQPGVLAFVQQGLPRLAPRACARVGAWCCRATGDETTRPAAAPLSRRDTVVGAAALLLAPLPSSAAKARKASNGKWAQHYGRKLQLPRGRCLEKNQILACICHHVLTFTAGKYTVYTY